MKQNLLVYVCLTKYCDSSISENINFSNIVIIIYAFSEEMPVLYSIFWCIYNISANSALIISVSFWTFMTVLVTAGKNPFLFITELRLR